MSKSNLSLIFWLRFVDYLSTKRTLGLFTIFCFVCGIFLLAPLPPVTTSPVASPSPLPFMAYPVSDQTPVPPLSASGIIVQDGESKVVLYSLNPDTQFLPASTTKLMTALVALDLYPNLDTPIQVTVEDKTVGQTMDLLRGETITVKNLLAGLLILSGNDAALALANGAPGGYDHFVAAMNQKGKALHLNNTTYKNPSGVEQYGHLTTARDLATLMSVVVQHDLLIAYMTTSTLHVTDITGQIRHYLSSTDKLLGQIPGLIGGKTGWTENAGECLVTYVRQNDHSIITVVLGSRDRFGETRTLLDWAFNHHQWIAPSL